MFRRKPRPLITTSFVGRCSPDFMLGYTLATARANAEIMGSPQAVTMNFDSITIEVRSDEDFDTIKRRYERAAWID